MPGPRLCLKPANELEAEIAIERGMVEIHHPSKPHAVAQPFIGRDQDAARLEPTPTAIKHE
jgi:hypothetical protein